MTPEVRDSEKPPDQSPPTSTMVLWLQMMLLPLCVWGMLMIPMEGVTLPKKLKGAFGIWVILTHFSLLVSSYVEDAKRIISFFMGSKEYRDRWFRLQAGAWIAMTGYQTMLFWGFRQFLNRNTGDAAVTTAIPTLVAGIGFYVYAMGRLPSEFFFNDPLGQKWHRFLGNPSSERIPSVCRSGCFGFFVTSLFLAWTDAWVFSSST